MFLIWCAYWEMSLTASIGGELNVLWSGDVLTTGRSRGLFSTMAARGAFHWMCSVLFCSRSISLSLFETLKGGALERGILSTIRPQTIPKTYQKYDWRTLKIKIEKWKLSRQCYTDYTNFLEYLIPIYNLFYTITAHVDVFSSFMVQWPQGMWLCCSPETI